MNSTNIYLFNNKYFEKYLNYFFYYIMLCILFCILYNFFLKLPKYKYLQKPLLQKPLLQESIIFNNKVLNKGDQVWYFNKVIIS